MGTSESTYGIPEENMLSFLPDFIFQTITQIRPAFLREHGTRGIREAMARYGAAPQQTALVGDQIYTDVLGAKRAGITAIAVRSIHNHTVWLKLRHLLELPFLAMARKRRVET